MFRTSLWFCTCSAPAAGRLVGWLSAQIAIGAEPSKGIPDGLSELASGESQFSAGFTRVERLKVWDGLQHIASQDAQATGQGASSLDQTRRQTQPRWPATSLPGH